MQDNTSGSYNTAIGLFSLYHNKANIGSVAYGYGAMQYADDRVSGLETYNTAIGYQSLRGSTTATNNTGRYNTALGNKTLYANTSGYANTAGGYVALYSNTTGYWNTANGYFSLFANTTGLRNTGNGSYSLRDNSTGRYNTASGAYALENNTTGYYNTAIGYTAYSTGTAYSNSTALGYDAEPGTSNRIRLGNDAITWIGGHSAWYNTSDARAKSNINEDVKGLDFILNLRPVTFFFDVAKTEMLIGKVDSSYYAEKYDIEKIKQSGFLAQEVEQAAINAGYDFSGVSKPKGDVKYYSLAYSEFVVPLVKGMQEQQVIIEEQQNEILELKARLSEIERVLLNKED